MSPLPRQSNPMPEVSSRTETSWPGYSYAYGSTSGHMNPGGPFT